MTWNLGDAMNRSPEVVNATPSEGPQAITQEDVTVILVSIAELNLHRPNFKDELTGGESYQGLDLARDPSPSRDLEW